MNNRQLLQLITDEIDDLEERYYANAGDAFCHFAMRTLFDLDEDDAYEACDVGGPDDKDLDAFWHDEASRRVLGVQAKYSAGGQARYDRSVVKDLVSAYGWLKRLADGRPSEARPQLRAAAEQLAEIRRVDREYPVELYCICLGSFTTSAREEAEAFNDEHRAEGVRISLVGIVELREAVTEQLSRDAAPFDEDIELHLLRYFPFDPPDQPRTIVGAVEGAVLAAIEAKHKYRIFQRNVRYYLKATQKVNKSIANTISNPETRPSFWYYNNGIAIVCNQFRLTEKSDGSAVVKLTNMQIVNGCQTTTTLGDHLPILQDEPAVHVLVRIIESPDEALQRDITLYNNRQNAVRDRDLLSNDDQQDRLHEEFQALSPPWFYERKRGEWNAIVKPSAKLRGKYGRHRLDNERAAQAAYAFHFNPAEARARKRLLFVPAQDGGFYDALFNEDTTPEWLLVPFLIDEEVAERKRAYLRQLREIKDPLRANPDQRRLLAYEWLKFADQMIVGAIAFYLRRRLEMDQEDLEALAADDFDRIIDKCYVLARRDLHTFFRSKEKAAGRRKPPETFPVANFVKGNWGEVLESLETEWEVREEQGEDPFAEIELLAR